MTIKPCIHPGAAAWKGHGMGVQESPPWGSGGAGPLLLTASAHLGVS